MGRITDIVRELRKNETPAEKLLWSELRRKKVQGCKFLRQQPIIYETFPEQRFFVADFYCAEKKLVIELDGEMHDFQKDYDANRSEILGKMELRVLRFKNEELEEMNRVLEKIAAALRNE